MYFSNDERGALSVTTARPDGSGRRILYTPEFLGGGDFAPLRWEPAGTRVAMRFDYTEDAENEAASRVEMIDVVTGAHTMFAGPGIDCGELTWSPTGTRLAMVCRSEPGSSPEPLRHGDRWHRRRQPGPRHGDGLGPHAGTLSHSHCRKRQIRDAPAIVAGASWIPRTGIGYWMFEVIQSYTAGRSVRWFSEVIRPQSWPS